jgi:hypothetical protein
MATSVKIIWSGCTPWATASEQSPAIVNIMPQARNLCELVFLMRGNKDFHLHARSLISPAAGNLRSQSALLGTRLRMLHLQHSLNINMNFKKPYATIFHINKNESNGRDVL